MADKNAKSGRAGAQVDSRAEDFVHQVIVWWLPILYFLISSLFYLRTYDSAQVKITVMQMGGLALLTLWVCRLLQAGIKAFTKDDLVCLSPFLAFLLVGILSYIHAPYHMASTDFFLRHCFFMTAALIVIYEFNLEATDRLTRILILTGWVAIGYGFIQYLDMKLFPPGVGNGIDPFIWRGAFGERIFSTYGNPNFYADFLVIIFPILLTQFLKTRRWSFVVLMGMLLVDLYATGTKGAWLGFALVVFLFGAISMIFFTEETRAYRKPILTVVAVGVLGFVGLVAKDLETRVVSINFRLFTWEATWEMIMTQPWTGTGIGSFPPIYPAFRRPPIFHIEGKHNTETDHAEDEYLEELFDNGILGFGVFLWLIFSTLVVGFRSLGQLTTLLRTRDGRAPPRAYDLIGYLVAFMGMLGHNFFDVSLRFVSSGVYLGLLSGMIVNLARGKGLYELHGMRESKTAVLPQGLAPSAVPATEAGPGMLTVLSEFLIWPARLAAWGFLVYTCGKILMEFNFLQGPVERLNIAGEVLQWWLSWGTLVSCVVGLGAAFTWLIYLSDNPALALAVLLALKPLYWFWGYFKADIHHNIAIFFSKDRKWDTALDHYMTVHKLNPDFVMSSYFMGNVFNDRFNMDKISNPAWGDAAGQIRDDYERALDSYNEVRRLAPNYVQMHHQVGTLHLKRAMWSLNHGHPEEAQFYLDRAMNRYRLYQQIDPVFPPNYYQMGQVYMMERKFDEMAKVERDNVMAPKCQVDPSLAKKKLLMRTILSYHSYVNEAGLPYPVHRHETAEAYTNLGNAYLLGQHLDEAQRAYEKALGLEPNFDQAKKNMVVLEATRKSKGHVQLPMPPLPPPPAVPLPIPVNEFHPVKP
ncbi:MAG: tetratricopeptide repeat protein [Elusimicrobia bacterium]|nr:tetratricopeptide repeat protein [Elusimicrobiota bacterium]